MPKPAKAETLGTFLQRLVPPKDAPRTPRERATITYAMLRRRKDAKP